MTTTEKLAAMGIDTSSPGFYNDTEFTLREARDPEFLCNYADFILEQAFSPEYLARARQVVEFAARFFDRELRRDGRKGACIDASMVMSRFLEEQGIWNFMVSGAVRLDFPMNAGMEPTYFWPITAPDSPAATGHMWLVAPPFRVVDVTLSHQPYSRGEEAWLSSPVLAMDVHPGGGVALHDLVEPEARAAFQMHFGRPMRMADVHRMDPSLGRKLERYGVLSLRHDSVSVTYMHCAISAPEPGPIGDMRNLVLCGRSPAELLEAFHRELAEAGIGDVP